MHLEDLLNINPTSKPLCKADVDTVVWTKLKRAKAQYTIPNYWEVLVSTKDARERGLEPIAVWCSRSIQEAYSKEGLSADDLMIVCMLSSKLKIGIVRATCECLDQSEKQAKVALARASGAIVRNTSAPVYVTKLWDGERVPVGNGIVIGHDPTCDIVVSADRVSRIHGQIVVRNDGDLTYIDRSEYGSEVDGVFVHHRRVSLKNGTYIGFTPGMFIQIQW